VPGVAAEWLERNFVYPDWPTNSTFSVVSPLVQTGVNADNLPIAQSVIANAHLEITQRFEMLDTVVGTAMGTTPASAGGAGTFLHSNRYVLKQTYTVKNIAGAAISNVQLFQLLHGLNSQRGVYDNRLYTGQLSNFCYDTTLAGVDAYAAGAGAGLEDFIGFHATSAPTALEIGSYGIEGNGVDNHGVGKPTDGVHLSIEANWLTAPYNTRQGTDNFAPPTRWVSGAQRWNLGNLSPNQSVSFDVVLSILTGTKVPTGTGSTGSCDGGSSVPGGIDYEFESVETEGTCFSDFARADQAELEVRIAQGDFAALTFQIPSQPAQVWKVEFSGSSTGSITVKFGYDRDARRSSECRLRLCQLGGRCRGRQHFTGLHFRRAGRSHARRELHRLRNRARHFHQLDPHCGRPKWLVNGASVSTAANYTFTVTANELIIYWSRADEAFVVEVPELPGCMADGASYEEAGANAQVVIQEWIETARALGRVIPEPRGKLAYA